MLQASTPNIRIGEQFDDARESTKLSGGAEILYNFYKLYKPISCL